MADLGTLRPGAANTTGLPTTGSLIGSPGGSTALSDDSDATFDAQNTNSSGTYQYGRELGNTPSDFATILTCSVQLKRAFQSAPTNTTWNSLSARIISGTTILAAATAGGTFEAVSSSITDTTPTNSSVVPFSYVNTAGTKAEWDAARLQVQWVRTRAKGGDAIALRVHEGFVTGTYTPESNDKSGASAITGTGPLTGSATTQRSGASAITGPGSVTGTGSAAEPTAYDAEIAADGAVGHWKFGEPSGTAAVDVIAGGGNGVYRNTPTLGVQGLIDNNLRGTAATFLASASEDVSVANVAAHDLGDGPLSIEGWYRRTTLSAGGYLFAEPSGAYVYVDFNGRIQTGATGVGDAFEGQGPDDLRRHHLVVTKDTGSTTWKMYLDGVDITPGTVTARTITSGSGASKYWASNNGSSPLDATLQEGAIYDSVLTPAEIASHFALGSFGQYADRVIDDGAAGVWKLNESSGDAIDLVGTNDGTVGGSPGRAVAGAVLDAGSAAIDLDGPTSGNMYVLVPDDAALDFADVFTMELWLRRTGDFASSDEPSFISKGNQGQAHFDSSDVITFSNDGSVCSTSSLAITDSLWHHVVLARDDTNDFIYIDGTDVTVAGTEAGRSTNATDLNIGRYYNPADALDYFDGEIQWVAVYPTALASWQVKAHFDLGQSLYGRSVLGDLPVAYFRMGEGDETLMLDSATGQNATTPTGGSAGTGLIAGDDDGAIDVDGTSGATLAANIDPWENDWSVEGWAEFDTDTGYQGLFSTGTYQVEGFRLARQSDKIHLWTSENVPPTGGFDIGSTGPVVDIAYGKVHFVATKFGTTFEIMVDNASAGTSTGTYIIPTAPSNIVFEINGASPLDGRLDELAIYGYALTATQIGAHFDLGNGGIVGGPATFTGVGSTTSTGTTTRSGASVTTGAGTATGAGQKDALGVATMPSGAGAAAGTGQKNALGTGAITGVGSAVATGVALQTATGTGAITGVGAITGAGEKASLGASVVPAGVGSEVAAGQKNGEDAGSLSGVGSLVDVATSERAGVGAITGVGSVTGDGNSVENHSGSGTITGVGSLVGQGEPGFTGVSAITGVGAAVALGLAGFLGASSFTGVGSLVDVATTERAGSGTTSGVGSIVGTGGQNEGHSGASAITGVGSAAATGQKDVVGTPIISGIGTPSASALHARAGAAAFAGSGSVTAFGGQNEGYAHPASFSGVGSVTAAGRKSNSDTGSVSGTGSIGSTGQKVGRDTGSLSGVGMLVAAYQTGRLGIGALGGSSGVTGAGAGDRFVSATISGVGLLEASGSPPPSLVGPIRARVAYAGLRATMTPTGQMRARIEG